MNIWVDIGILIFSHSTEISSNLHFYPSLILVHILLLFIMPLLSLATWLLGFEKIKDSLNNTYQYWTIESRMAAILFV